MKISQVNLRNWREHWTMITIPIHRFTYLHYYSHIVWFRQYKTHAFIGPQARCKIALFIKCTVIHWVQLRLSLYRFYNLSQIRGSVTWQCRTNSVDFWSVNFFQPSIHLLILLYMKFDMKTNSTYKPLMPNWEEKSFRRHSYNNKNSISINHKHRIR